MRNVLAGTSLSTLLLIAPLSPALAETVISTATTAPIATGTGNDDIRITNTGSVRPTSGAAVTINSNDSVTNQGVIGIAGANNASGILANPNLTGNIVNTGTITIDENFTPTDTDTDGDLDGPFAQGTGRFGIHVLGGGTFTGNVTNGGPITVEGNASAGIAIDSALIGSVTNTGNINVLGDNSVALRAVDVSGNVTLSGGTITAQGANAVGVSLGDVGGALVIQNTINVTGYRHPTPPADVTKLDADDLLQGGPAVVVSGDVGGGILFDARPADNSTTDTDEDDDGVPDADESTAAVTSVGAAAAVQIGSATRDIAIGAVASSTAGHGLVVKGTITGNGVYTGVNANGIVVGGLGRAVDLAGGMTIVGTVQTRATGASATSIRVGSGTSAPQIVVSGTVNAEGGGTATTSAQAIAIDAGATVTSLTNSGTIVAARLGDAGTAAGIVDRSGTLALIENSGFIGVVDVAGLGVNGIAFDLSSNAAGATVRQIAAATGRPAPSINGTMLFGAGNDVLNVAAGTVRGNATFGAGNNQLALSGDSRMTGSATFGAGGDSVTLGGTSSLLGNLNFGGGADTFALSGTSVFRGQLSGGSGLAVSVGTGSTLGVTNTGTVALASLDAAAGSTIGVTIATGGATTLYDIAGAASFGTGSEVEVDFVNVGNVEGTYTFLQAGTLTGGGNVVATGADLPFLFEGDVVQTDPNELSIVVRLRSAEELGLNRSESEILRAALGAADSEADFTRLFLGINDNGSLTDTLQQLLPEHSGGAFESVTKGSRLIAGILSDPRAPILDRGDFGVWLQQVAWGTSKSVGATSSYDLTGWGASGGLEYHLGAIGNLGVSLAYLSGKDSKGDNELISSQYEGGVYWRGGSGPLRGFARATAARINFDGTRTLTTDIGGTAFTRSAEGDWTGRLFSAMAGVSYEARMGKLSLRPSASVEHFKLTEKGYSEIDGGDAFNLTVGKRSSDETAVNGLLTIGYDLLSVDPESAWLRVELEGGRRQIISGSLGKTSAAFAGGNPFTLTPEDRTSGFRGALRLIGGGPSISVVGEVNAEQQQGKASVGGRLGVQFAH